MVYLVMFKNILYIILNIHILLYYNLYLITTIDFYKHNSFLLPIISFENKSIN